MSGPAHPGPDGEGEVAEALALAHRLAVLAETDPDAPLLVAARAAIDVADARRAAHRARRLAGLEVHGDDGPTWARWADQWLPHDELTRRRAAPVDQRRDDPAPPGLTRARQPQPAPLRRPWWVARDRGQARP